MKTENISNYLEHYRKTTLDVNPVFSPTSKEVVELIDLYSVDKFRDDQYDELGFLKPFYNVIETPVQVAANWIDLDVKNVHLLGEGENYYPVWLMEKDLRVWMRDNKNCYADGRLMSFGSFLNSIIPSWVRYGHLVLKKADNKVYLMPISNLMVEPGAESLTNARYIIEKHDYSPAELRKKNWDNIGKAIKLQKDGHIYVYEVCAEQENETDNYFIVAVKPHRWYKDLGEGVVLYSTKLDELPYRELPFKKIPGRWLGRGMVEQLFHSQIYQNRIAKYKAKGAHWTSKHIYQTRDETVDKNLMTEVKDGTVITPMSEIMPIAVEERNLHFYREEEERYDFLVDKLSFAWDVTRGQRQPAGTTLGQTMLQSQSAGSFYKRKKEELGLFLKDILYDWVLPQFRNQRNVAHRLSLDNFSDDELNTFRDLVFKKKSGDAIIDFIRSNNRLPSDDEVDALKAITKEEIKSQKDISIPKDFFKNLKYKINIDITGESIDLASRVTTLQTVLVMLSQNPTILKDKNTRRIFFELLDSVGISPAKFRVEDESDLEQAIAGAGQTAQRGGSVARMPQNNMPSVQPTVANV